MGEAKMMLENARKARQLQNLLEAEGYGETFDLQMKLGEFVDWVINEMFLYGVLEMDHVEILRLYIESTSIEQAAKARGCTSVWFHKLINKICKSVDEGMGA